jgi:hypothetical protein
MVTALVREGSWSDDELNALRLEINSARKKTERTQP